MSCGKVKLYMVDKVLGGEMTDWFARWRCEWLGSEIKEFAII